MRTTIIFLIILLFNYSNLLGQDKEYHVVQYRIVGTDTIPYVKVSGVEIFDFKIFKTKREAKRNSRLIRNVKAVYPWAKLAGVKLQEYETILLETESEKEQRKIMKQVEKEINDQYGGELKKCLN